MSQRWPAWTATLTLLTALSCTHSLAMPPEREAWLRVETKNFTLVGNVKKSRLADMGSQLELLREVLSRTSEGMVLNSPLPTTIFVFKDTESFAPYNLDENGQPDNTSGYFLPSLDANYVAIDASSTSPLSVVYHEYLHYVLENSVPAIPLWLNEGLAEFYSTFQVTKDGAEIGLPITEHLHWLSEHTMTFDALFAVDTGSETYNEGERQGTFYAQSWALAHYLVVDPQRRQRLGRFLGLLGTGTLSAEAFETAFEADIVAAEKELREYIRREQLSFFRYTPEKQLEERSVEVQRLAHKETLFLLGDLLAHQLPVRGEAAEQHLRAALALDESYVDASVALAMLRFLQQRPDEAVALASEAIALDPEHPRALVIRGMSRLMQFFVEYESESAEAENHKQVLLLAREDFRTKLKRSPDDVSALIGLGETYVLEGEDPQEGISALAQASAARPARTDVLSKLIALTARSGNIAGAENLLAIGLRPRGDVDSIAIAEDALVREQMKEVDRLLRDNDPEQALSLARKIAGGITTEIVRRPLTKWIAGASAEYRAELLRREAIAAGAAGDKERARELMQQAGATYGDDGQGTTERNRFNAAIQLMNQGQYETALEQFEQIARSKSGSVANERSIEHAKELRRIISHNRNVARLNTALETIKAGAADRAISLLLEVLEDDLDNQLRVEAERLLREARRRAKVPD